MKTTTQKNMTKKEPCDSAKRDAKFQKILQDLGILSAHSRFGPRAGALIRDTGAPNDAVQIKEFDFGAFDLRHVGSDGWRYTSFKVTLERISRPNTNPYVVAYTTYSAISYGRWTGDYTPHQYTMRVFSGDTALYSFSLGKAHLWCDNGYNQGVHIPALIVPLPPGYKDQYPYEYFKLFTKAELFGEGNQESC